MSVRQQDIARYLGVSLGTVSQALRNSPQVSIETRMEVRRVALELGYVYHPRETYGREIKKLAFISGAQPSNFFYTGVLQGIEQACQELKINLHYSLLTNITAHMLQQYNTNDALLIAGFVDQQRVRALKNLELPIVLIDTNLSHLGLERVEIENFGSVYQAVEHFVLEGHQKIAFLCGPPPVRFSSFDNRRQGYLHAMRERGLETYEIEGLSEPLLKSSEQVMTRWLEQHGKPEFTLLLCCNDEAAIGASIAFRLYGIEVPQDVSLVGFDDIEMAQVVHPALSTFRIDREFLGKLAVEQVVKRFNQPDRPVQSTLIETSFIRRASTRSLL